MAVLRYVKTPAQVAAATQSDPEFLKSRVRSVRCVYETDAKIAAALVPRPLRPAERPEMCVTFSHVAMQITRDERELHRWTVRGTSYVTPDGYPFEVEQLDTMWHGTRTVWNVTESSSASCSKSVSSESGDGSGSASTPFQAFPTYPGAYSLTAADPGHEFEFTRKFMTSDCNGTSTSQGTEMKGELLAYLGMVAELSMLTPAPNDPGHFAGRVTLIHDEQPRPGGGSEIQDVTVTRDLRRTEQR